MYILEPKENISLCVDKSSDRCKEIHFFLCVEISEIYNQKSCANIQDTCEDHFNGCSSLGIMLPLDFLGRLHTYDYSSLDVFLQFHHKKVKFILHYRKKIMGKK